MCSVLRNLTPSFPVFVQLPDQSHVRALLMYGIDLGCDQLVPQRRFDGSPTNPLWSSHQTIRCWTVVSDHQCPSTSIAPEVLNFHWSLLISIGCHFSWINVVLFSITTLLLKQVNDPLCWSIDDVTARFVHGCPCDQCSDTPSDVRLRCDLASTIIELQ